MSKYICPNCNYDFKQKSHYVNHTEKKKKPCNPNNKKLPEPTNFNEKLPILPEINEIIININNMCTFCNKTYSDKYKLARHQTTCKKKKESEKKMDDIQFLKNKIVELEGKLNNNPVINNTNNTNTNNSNNNTTNNTTNNTQNININISNFGTLDHKKIDDKVFYNSMIKYSGLTPLLKFIEYIHKNDKFPEYKNVEITDLARNLGRFIEDNKWKISDANEIVDKVIDETYNYYEVKFNELEEEIDQKPQTEKTKIKRNKRFINTMRGNEHFDQNDDGDFVDDDGKYVTIKDFQEGRKFEDKLKKKVKCSLNK
jgi:hypothetical protein